MYVRICMPMYECAPSLFAVSTTPLELEAVLFGLEMKPLEQKYPKDILFMVVHTYAYVHTYICMYIVRCICTLWTYIVYGAVFNSVLFQGQLCVCTYN